MRGQTITLTPVERKMLFFLAENRGKICFAENICAAVWPAEIEDVKSRLPYHIYRIRKKLGLTPTDTDYIKQVPKIGYIFAPNVDF